MFLILIRGAEGCGDVRLAGYGVEQIQHFESICLGHMERESQRSWRPICIGVAVELPA
jgi:hypothetical protein